VTVDKLPAGVYRVKTRALDRANGAVLFQATREMTAKPTSALASVKSALQNLVLSYAKDDTRGGAQT
jgi:beta-xylosidase